MNYDRCGRYIPEVVRFQGILLIALIVVCNPANTLANDTVENTEDSEVESFDDSAQGNVTPTAPLDESLATQLGYIRGRLDADQSALDAYKSALEALDTEVRAYKDFKSQVFMFGGVLTFLMGIFFWNLFQGTARKAEQHVMRETDRALLDAKSKHEEALSVLANDRFREIEDKQLQYMQITALRNAGRYDEALEVAPVSLEDPEALERFPGAVQRSLIASLAKSQTARQNGRGDIAWSWASRLAEREPTRLNLSSLLAAGISLKRYDTTLQEFDRICRNVSAEVKEACNELVFVCLRKATDHSTKKARQNRLRDIVENTLGKPPRSHRFQASLAAYHRDMGDFTKAADLVSLTVTRYTGHTHNDRDWTYVFTTYVANCIDQGAPDKAIEQAKTILANSRDPRRVFDCSRLVWRLEPSADRKALLLSIRNRFDDGLMPSLDEATIKTLAVVDSIDGRHEDAIGRLERAIKQGRSAITSMDRKSLSTTRERNSLYYMTCLLSEVLTDKGDYDGAVEVLIDVSEKDRVGEAHFLQARAESLRERSDDAISSLRFAAERRRKWLEKAKYDDAFKSVEEGISELVVSNPR